MKGGYDDSPKAAFDRLPFDYGITGIHEMLHQIIKNMYDEADLNRAAYHLGATGIDNYLNKNCLPREYLPPAKKE
ncbi:MAG TPA: hypothetical protein DC054_06575 [Blastocatellia bacterium]|nr:hypothetical protein [Blastocatellia bacterium]